MKIVRSLVLCHISKWKANKGALKYDRRTQNLNGLFCRAWGRNELAKEGKVNKTYTQKLS